MMQGRRALMLVALLLTGLSYTTVQGAGPEPLCFPDVPGITNCIEGRFLEYWTQNGGLPVFGYPISAARNEVNRDTGLSYLTQWFERARFELHPENRRPDDVLLGRLGDDRLLQLGVDWTKLPREAAVKPGCRWFYQTSRNVCNQDQGIGFMTYWETHGLELDGRPGSSVVESTALFGLPLTSAGIETNSSGQTVLTQWFERARFEWHPDHPDKVLLGLLGDELVQAQRGPLCFKDVPDVSNCIEGRFRDYWLENGGLPVFGYPITSQYREVNRDAGTEYETQWFERARFELHPENQRPYDVLLGRLGDDRLLQTGREWQNFPLEEQKENCLFFPETQHRICDQEQSIGFLSYWRTHGLELDGKPGTSQAESLALFGLPISNPFVETNVAGDAVWTQWFERARFEYHPGNQAQERVLLGLLGNEVLSNPPILQPATCEGVKAGFNGTLTPNCVPFGATMQVRIQGFQPGQTFAFNIVNHLGVAQSVWRLEADATGGQPGLINTADWYGQKLEPGSYVFVAAVPGAERATVTIPFRVIPVDG